VSLLVAPELFGKSGFPEEAAARALFPTPKDVAVVGVNPPGFAWWRAEGAGEYRLTIYDAAKRPAYEAVKLTDPVHVPAETLPAGEYTWNVEALDGAGRTIASRGAWRFRVPEGVPEMPWRNPLALLGQVPEKRPRYIFMADELPRVCRILQGIPKLHRPWDEPAGAGVLDVRRREVRTGGKEDSARMRIVGD